MTRFLQLDQNPPFDSNEIESIDLSSITDSHLNSVTNGSAFASDNLKATSAESACLDSTLEATESKVTLHGRSNEISFLHGAFYTSKTNTYTTINKDKNIQPFYCACSRRFWIRQKSFGRAIITSTHYQSSCIFCSRKILIKRRHSRTSCS
jgi:hypothetical protein